MKQQKINREKPKAAIIYDRIEERTPTNIPKVNDIPIRSVVYVEVKDMSKSQVGMILAQVNESYKDARGGIHYIIPVRFGKLSTDILFENEILDLVNKICDVVDGKIAMKNGFQEVKVIRETV